MSNQEERHYFPTTQQQAEHELISIKSMRNDIGEEVAHFTDEQMEDLREKLYALSYFIYYDWIDSIKK